MGILDNKTSEVSRETNLSNSIFLTKQKETKVFLIRNEVCLKILRIKLQKRKEMLENKEKMKTNCQNFA